MDKKQFQDAFSVVRASDELRLEVTNMTKNQKAPTRILRGILIAAVITALLTITTIAAPAIINAVKGGTAEINKEVGTHGNVYWLPGSNELYNDYDVYLDLELNPNAPDDFLIHYLPDIPKGYTQTLGYQSDIERTYLWATDAEGSTFLHPDEIQFMQWHGQHWKEQKSEQGRWACWITVPEGEEPQTKMIELGGATGFLVESDYGYGSRIFFWSDGDYVFKLEVPDEYTDAQLAALIESVHVVDNIDPYIWND